MSGRIVVMGAGAVGGYVGAHLFRAGRDVTLVDGWPAHVAQVRRHGLAIEGMTPEESVTIRVPILGPGEVAPRREPVDIAFIAVKSYDTVAAVEAVRPFLSPSALVVSLQNGINEETIAGLVGPERTAGTIAARISVELDRAGHIRRHVPRGGPGIDVFRVGSFAGPVTPAIEALGALIGLVDSVKVTDNLLGERWSKLAVNAMRNGVSAATGLPINALDRDPDVRRFAIRVAGEVVQVARHLGVRLEAIGIIAPDDLGRAAAGDEAALASIEGALLAAAADTKARSDAQRPSMAQDVAKGRSTEVEAIYGLVVAKAAALGLPVPANAALRHLVQRIERHELSPDPAHLRALEGGLSAP